MNKLYLVNALKDRKIEFGFNLQNIQTIFEPFKYNLFTYR